MDCQGAHDTVSSGAGTETGVQRAVEIQPRNPRAGDAVDVQKIAGDEHLAGENGIGRIRQHTVNRTVHAGDVEGAVEGAIFIEPRHLAAGRAVEIAKVAAEVDPASPVRQIGFRHGIDRRIHTAAGIEARVHRAVRPQPADEIAVNGVDEGEGAAQDDTVIALHAERIHGVVRTREAVQEISVQGAARTQARHPVARHAVGRGETAARDNAAVRLQTQGQHVVVHAGVMIERHILGAGRLVERLRVLDFHQGIGLVTQQPGRGGGRQVDGKVETVRRRIADSVVKNADIKTPRQFATGKGQRPIRAGIVDTVQGEGIGGGEVHRDRLAGSARTHHGDGGHTAAFVDLIS